MVVRLLRLTRVLCLSLGRGEEETGSVVQDGRRIGDRRSWFRKKQERIASGVRMIFR